MDEYECVAKGKLKLKSDSSVKKKKSKKNKKKKSEKVQQAVKSQVNDEDSERATYVRKLTQAELAFKQQQERMKNKRIMEKASMTHKERVEKFNEHLDSLTEHFDIPKVSWTK